MDGGWAANANLSVALSDLGTVNASGRIETAGFGALDQSLSERRMDDYTQFSVSTSLELGKFFPEKAKVSIPFYYAYSKETTTPKYDPLNQDIKMSESLNNLDTDAQRDSVKSYSIDQTVIKSFSLTEYETTKNYQGNFAYSYTPYAKPFRPFEKLKKNNGYTKYLKQFSLNYLPSSINFMRSRCAT